MTNEEKAREIAGLCCNCSVDGINSCSECERRGKYVGALEIAEWKDQQFKEYLEENLSDIVFECIEEYKKLKGSLNDDGTLRSDYQLAQDITIAYQYKIINELFPEQEQDNSDNDE